MKRHERFLLIDDDADARFLNRRALERAFAGCEVVEAGDCDGALAQVGNMEFAAVLADHQLQGKNGVECIAMLRRRGVTCPIMMVTGNENPRIHAEALASGATKVFDPRNPDFIGYLLTLLGGP